MKNIALNNDNTESQVYSFINKYSKVLLHLCFFIYSFVGVAFKWAVRYPLTDIRMYMFIGIGGLILVVYAVLWQKVLQLMDLSTAYSNKGIVIIWTLLWAMMFFKEKITLMNIVGSIVIILGIVLLSFSERKKI